MAGTVAGVRQAFHNSAEAGRIEDRTEAAGSPVERTAAGPGDIPDEGEGPEKHLRARNTPGERQMAKDQVWEAPD